MTRIIDSTLNTQGLADDQRGLLELIDKLQFAQLDNVKLPQIVVVGDQSAGKSSVLEALTGTPFPRDSGACTRFATEIRMRRAKQSSLKVSIIPDRNRPQSEQMRMAQFGGNVNENTSFESMMREAVEIIAPKGVPGRFAARDILVVEKLGPDMPLLTLVDLPGLVRVANRDQSENDIRTIEALSDRYMKSSRTIILAVIGGNNDYVQAPILRKAREFDPSGSRTIGVLTKPDLTESIGLEDKFIELVMNEDAENHFKLGWYVLLNPGPPANGQAWPTPEQRLAREEEFFSRGKWSTLPASMRGVSALRQKLSVQLQKHIGRHIPSLRKQIQDALSRCDSELKQLGEGKDTVEEMKLEMGELFSTSNNLVTPAINGNYKNPPGEKFFPRQAITKGTPSQRLRARVREESERFARRFRDSARKVKFAETGAGSGASILNGLSDHSKREFARSHVEPLLAQVRGTELPMDSNPRAPYILFQDYAESWPTISTEFKDNIVVICNEFLSEIIDYVWPMRMRSPLREHYLEPMMMELVKQAEKELIRLTEDMELEIQPFDPEYEERLKAWRVAASQEGATYTEAEEVLEKMLIYYDCTARIFIRNVITQVAERYLILGLLRLFNPVKILQMSNQVVEAIAAENKETRDRRATLKKQKQAIEEAKALCANLAMRSDLRAAYEENYGQDSDEEKDQSSYLQAQQVPIHRRPTPSQSIWTWMGYWCSDAINIGTWEAASSIIAVGLTWRDAIPIVVVATAIVAIPMVLNGAMGARLHIPFSVVVRAAFGYYFAYYCIISRAVLAAFWLGVQSVSGSQCITIMLTAIWPSYGTLTNHLPDSAGITTQGMVSYILFWIVQMPLLLIPPQKLKWLFIAKMVVAPIVALATLGWCVHRAGGAGDIFDQKPSVHGANKAFLWLSCMTSITGSWSTMACNIADFSRYSKTRQGQFIQLPFIPIIFTICSVFGIITTSAGNVIWGEFLWNPLDILDKWLAMGSGGRAAGFFAALAWFIVQVGSNITSNCISAANDLTVLFPKYVNIHRGCIITAIAGGWVFVPWKILASASSFLAFMGGYAVFLGPIAGVIIADYWLVRRLKVDVPAMYDPQGRYHYWHGLNWRALVTVLCASAPNLPGLAHAINSKTVHISTGSSRLYSFNYLFGISVAVVVYWALCTISPPTDTFVAKTIYGKEDESIASEDAEKKIAGEEKSL